MSRAAKVRCLQGGTFEFFDDVHASGSVKDVFLSPDASYVAALYKSPQADSAKDRLAKIVGAYRDDLMQPPGGQYWQQLFCWPEKTFEYNGRLGLVIPRYRREFWFEFGSYDNDFLNIKGKEKQGKWFATPQHQLRYLDARERGDWRNYVRACIQMARAVARLHRMGLAHSDLSYKNVLLDPVSGSACVIDIDGLVVPNKFPPAVLGTADFIAPEVVKTSNLSLSDKRRRVPCITTDRHALAVMIYMYLLYRHPLKGDKFHADDPALDDKLMMGDRALFIEHPRDHGNRIVLSKRSLSEQKWGQRWLDTEAIPYTVAGPYLRPLFDRAFVDGLHDPNARPTAGEWEEALVRTVDLLLPCRNPSCQQKWFVLQTPKDIACPFCGALYRDTVPTLNFYSKDFRGDYTSEPHRLCVFESQELYLWHCDRNLFPGPQLSPSQLQRLAYFRKSEGQWILVNEGLTKLLDATVDGQPKLIPVHTQFPLRVGQKLLLLGVGPGRAAVVQIFNSP